MRYLFRNNKNHIIQLPDRSGKMVCFVENQKKVLDEWFRRYSPKYLDVVKVIRDNSGDVKDNIQVDNTKVKIKRSKKHPVAKNISVNNQSTRRTDPPVKSRIKRQRGVRVERVERTKTGNSKISINRRCSYGRKIVGKSAATGRYNATEFSVSRIKENSIAISNHIGVGILSYNRLGSLISLIESIRKHTNLNKTTVFVSDESSDPKVWNWLKNQNDIIGFHNERHGIAVNSNRLLRCLSRFKYKLLLNDDVEVLKEGWDSVYFDAMKKYKLNHFCYRQEGIYGAVRPNPSNGLIKIEDRPHGAVMAFDDKAFSKVGYFDENFGFYGLEHVDFSNRIAKAVHNKNGYFDIANSDKFFKVYPDKTSDENKSTHFKQAKAYFEQVKTQNRIYVEATNKSCVSGVSCIIPFRDLGREDSIATVVNNIRAQRYPFIQILLVEQDGSSKINKKKFPCIEHILVKNWKNGMHFCKSAAFNKGVEKASFNKLILHDADMLVRSDYIKRISDLLNKYESVHIGKNVCYMDKDATDKIISKSAIQRESISSDRIVGYYEGGSLGIVKTAYIRIGGFCEDFIGYGCEDTEFYYRITKATKSFTERSIDLFHLWHGRTNGWGDKHEVNKKIQDKMFNTPIDKVINKLNKYYIKKYGAR